MARNVFIPIPGNLRLSAMLQDGAGMTEEAAGISPASNSRRAKTLVIMLHGFPGHKSAQNDVFGDLEFQVGRDGFHSLRFDFRGCGESEGKSEDFMMETACADVRAILEWARSFGYERFFYIGEGLGAAIALLNADPGVRGAALLWPALDPRLTALREPLKLAGSKEAKAQGYVVWRDTKIGLPLLKEIKLLNPTRKLRNLKIPLLIQQGTADEEVSPAQMELLRRHARSIRRIEMTTYEGAGHGLHGLQERQTMFYHIRQFLKRYG